MKKHKLIGLAVASVGAIMYAASIQYSSVVLVIGVGWFIVGRAFD